MNVFYILICNYLFKKIAISGPWLWLVVLLKEIKKQWEPFRSFLRYTALPSEQWLNTTEVKTLSWLGFLMLDETLWPKPSRMREFFSSSWEVRQGLMQRPQRNSRSARLAPQGSLSSLFPYTTQEHLPRGGLVCCAHPLQENALQACLQAIKWGYFVS